MLSSSRKLEVTTSFHLDNHIISWLEYDPGGNLRPLSTYLHRLLTVSQVHVHVLAGIVVHA